MKTITVSKARRTFTGVPTDPAEIRITAELPRFETQEEAEAAYALDAERIATALRRSLPNATYDRLFLIMLKRQASLLTEGYTLPRL